MGLLLRREKKEPFNTKSNMGTLHLLHINVNGLRTRAAELSSYIEDCKDPVDIILINETKLNGHAAPRLSGYSVAALRDRESAKTQGGGVAIYVAKQFKFADISPGTDDVVAIELQAMNRSIAVVSYYRPPDADGINSPALEPFLAKHEQCTIVGDFNAKHQYFGCKKTDPAGEQLFDFIERHDLVVANPPGEATRSTTGRGDDDIIDYCLVTHKLSSRLQDCYVGDDVGSDHLPLHVKLQLGGSVAKYPCRLTRNIAKCDWQLFSHEMEAGIHNTPDQLLNSAAAIEERCQAVASCITAAIDTACPKRAVKEGALRLSAATVALIRRRRKVRRLLQSRRDPVLRTVYNNLKGQVDRAIAAERRQGWEQATGSLNELKGRDLWRKFHMLTGTGKPPAAAGLRLTKPDGTMTSGAAETADEFARHLEAVHTTHEGAPFCDTFKRQVESSMTANEVHFKPCFSAALEAGDDSQLIAPISAAEVGATLLRCKTRSAAGEDEISYSMLKKLPLGSLGILAQIYSICLNTGYFPGCWKTALGVLLLKKGKNKSSASNYRPISLLSTLGKLFERIVANRLYTHLYAQSFFNPWQRGYLHRKEAWEHVYRVDAEVRLAKSNKWTTTAVALDVEKAFDSVWHDGVRYKLAALGLPVKLVRLVSSFLTGRTIRVRVEGELSAPVTLHAGTPQGSVLSPLLFNMYVNDIPVNAANKCQAGQFADDLSLWTSAKRKPHTYLRLQRCLSDIERWCSVWRVKINVAKTQLMSFSRSRQPCKPLHLFGEAIKEQKELTLLGVTFDQGLTYRSHCAVKAKTASTRINLLRRLRGQRWGTSSRTLLQFYKSFIRPVLETGYVCTARASKTSRTTLQRTQNTALRTVLKAPFRTRITRLHEQAGIEYLSARLRAMRRKAITRFGDSKLMQEVATQRALLKPARRPKAVHRRRRR